MCSQLGLCLGLGADILKQVKKLKRLLQAFTLLTSVSYQIPILGSSRTVSLLGEKKAEVTSRGTEQQDLQRPFSCLILLHCCLWVHVRLAQKTRGRHLPNTHGIGFLASWRRYLLWEVSSLNRKRLRSPVGLHRLTAISHRFGSRSLEFWYHKPFFPLSQPCVIPCSR